MRGDGKTTRQMEAAPQNAVFIWCNSHLDYPRKLANQLRRDDLKIVSPSWLTDRRWQGLELSGIILDHAVQLTVNEDESYLMALAQVRKP